MKAAKPLHIVLATNPNPTRTRGYPLNINPKPDPKPDSISGPAGSGRVADLYLPDRPCTPMGRDNSESGRSRHPDFLQLLSPFPGSIQWLARGFFRRGATVSTATGLDAYSSILSQVQNPGGCQRLELAVPPDSFPTRA